MAAKPAVSNAKVGSAVIARANSDSPIGLTIRHFGQFAATGVSPPFLSIDADLWFRQWNLTR